MPSRWLDPVRWWGLVSLHVHPVVTGGRVMPHLLTPGAIWSRWSTLMGPTRCPERRRGWLLRRVRCDPPLALAGTVALRPAQLTNCNTRRAPAGPPRPVERGPWVTRSLQSSVASSTSHSVPTSCSLIVTGLPARTAHSLIVGVVRLFVVRGRPHRDACSSR